MMHHAPAGSRKISTAAIVCLFFCFHLSLAWFSCLNRTYNHHESVRCRKIFEGNLAASLTSLSYSRPRGQRQRATFLSYQKRTCRCICVTRATFKCLEFFKAHCLRYPSHAAVVSACLMLMTCLTRTRTVRRYRVRCVCRRPRE